MSERFRLFIDLITDSARRELDDFSKQVDRVGAKWQRIKITVQREATGILRTIGSLVNLAQNVMDQFGVILGPFEEWIFGLIGIMVTTLLNMSVAASSTVIGAPLGILIAASAGIFSAATLTLAAAGMDDARDNMNKISATMSGLGSFVGSLIWLG